LSDTRKAIIRGLRYKKKSGSEVNPRKENKKLSRSSQKEKIYICQNKTHKNRGAYLEISQFFRNRESKRGGERGIGRLSTENDFVRVKG